MKQFLTIILIFSTLFSFAQNYNTETEPKFGIGLIGGANISSFSFSNENLANYKSDLFINYQYGVVSEMYFSKSLSLRPSITFAGRGTKITDNNINYMLASKNIDISFPIVLSASASNVRPFIYVAPVIESTFGGIIGFADKSTPITTANHSKLGFAVTPGAGLKFMLSEKNYFSIEGAYHLGLSNTYSETEIAGTANAINMADYAIIGTRKNRAIELMFTFMIVINKKKENNNNNNNSDDDYVYDDTPKKDTVKVVIVEDEPETDDPTPTKKVYTVDEIEREIELGIDVTDRKIVFKNIEFEFNKAELREGSKQYLDEIVAFMNKNPSFEIRVNGHTDNVGSNDKNMNLSVERAKTVYNYIISKGIGKDMLNYKGFGDTKPISTNETEEGRAKNRRVEFQIVAY